jgi:hypothetical protein
MSSTTSKMSGSGDPLSVSQGLCGTSFIAENNLHLSVLSEPSLMMTEMKNPIHVI